MRAVAVILLLFGCAEKEVLSPCATDRFCVSGTLTQVNARSLQEDARVLVAWVVVEAEDYIYVFGSGTIDIQSMTFEVVFEGDPPSDALNGDALGVGVMLLTTDHTIKEGPLLDADPLFDNALGGAEDYGVIFIQSGQEALLEGLGWPETFPTGYSVGKGTEVEESGFEGFERVAPSTLEIIIDDPDNLEFVNWT